MADPPYLVVGLGNPGPTYARNRHNIGAMVCDLIVGKAGGRFRRHSRAQAEACELRLGGVPGIRVVLAKPLSYMNLSGGPVAGLAGFYKIPVDHIIVVHDELDVPYGAVRLKLGGGEGGHNGLRSVSKSLGTRDYLRVRCGIGRPPGRQDPADFVLSDFSSTERKELDLVLDRAADALEALIEQGLEPAQNTFHAQL